MMFILAGKGESGMFGGETDATKCKNAEVHRVNGLYRYAKARNS